MSFERNVKNAPSCQGINYCDAATAVANKYLVCLWIEPDVVGIITEVQPIFERIVWSLVNSDSAVSSICNIERIDRWDVPDTLRFF